MNQVVVWGAAAVTAAFVFTGITGSLEFDTTPEDEARIEESDDLFVIPEPIVVESALVTAAFGMEALQPDTYDGLLVMDLIEASPLEETAKLRLSVNLAAAEAGRADLFQVLSDVRIALAVD